MITLILKFDKNFLFIYNDVRKFGFIKVYKTKKFHLSPSFKKLGPEPLSKKFNFSYFKKKLKK